MEPSCHNRGPHCGTRPAKSTRPASPVKPTGPVSPAKLIMKTGCVNYLIYNNIIKFSYENHE